MEFEEPIEIGSRKQKTTSGSQRTNTKLLVWHQSDGSIGETLHFAAANSKSFSGKWNDEKRFLAILADGKPILGAQGKVSLPTRLRPAPRFAGPAGVLRATSTVVLGGYIFRS